MFARLLDYAQAITTLHAALAIVAAVLLVPVFRFVRKRHTRAAAQYHALGRLAAQSHRFEELLALAPSIKRIETALLPNGGSAIPDRLVALERLIDRADALRQALWRQMDSKSFALDEHGLFARGNRAFYRLTGATPAECQALGWVNVFHPTVRSRIRAELQAAMAGVPSDFQIPALLDDDHGVTPVVLSGTAIVGAARLEAGPSCYGWSVELEPVNGPR